MIVKYSVCVLVFVAMFTAAAEEIPMADDSRFELENAVMEPDTLAGMSALKVTQKNLNIGEAYAIVKGANFHNGTIEVDVAGSPLKIAGEGARGFIGVAFRVQEQGPRLEAFYIRPTNGRTSDQLRRNHATQYVSVPDWTWERLRKESPGVYESYADMESGEWTHLKIVAKGATASLYVGDAKQPTLVVNELKQGDSTGGVALWIGSGTEGRFRNLRILPDGEQAPEFGANTDAGHYVQTSDGKMYYERYGEGGRPLVLLHGGEYGYIDEFEGLIREMSKRRTVIAIATRGYGRSDRGTVKLSHRQFAKDAADVMRTVLKPGEQADVLGFSEGAITSYLVAATYPNLVHRLVAISGSLGPYGHNRGALEAEPFTPEVMQKQVPELVASRKRIMAKPEQWEPLIREIEEMCRAPFYVKQEEVRKIAAPTLILAGDQDYYNRLDHLVDIYHLLPKGQLAFIPGCGHVVLNCKADLTIGLVSSFLDQIRTK